MPDEIQDVNTAEPSAAETEVVNEEQAVETTPQQEATTTEPQDIAPLPDSVAGEPQDEVDEKGVPWKNRAMEWRRKHDETVAKIPQLIEDGLRKYSTGSKQEYTPEQLRTFAYQTDNAAHQQWALGEASRIEGERNNKAMVDTIRTELDARERKVQEQQIKTQSVQYVFNNYPDMFVKNASGQIIGMNNRNPMTAIVNKIMEDPEAKNNPRGIMIAADIAFAQVARQGGLSAIQQNQKLKAEVKNLQRGTLIEGGGKQSVASKTAKQAALEKLQKTGSLQDGVEALKAMDSERRRAKER